MEVTLALLADFANHTSDGKLNILGVFDTINAAEYPALHPEMKLVVRYRMHPAEVEEPKRIDIQLLREDGQRVFQVSGNIAVQAQGGNRPLGR